MSDRPRVVIAGAGFGGLWAARTIAPFNVDVLLIDQNNYHIFLPLLYQVAAAELEPEEIAHPVRSILRKLPNVQFALAKVESIDPVAKMVKTENRMIPFDYLVLSTGSVPEFFGIPGADKYALPLKTLEDGIAIRSQILACFEKAVHETDHRQRQRMLTFTIVGGGPTGVEFAGALVELIRGALVKDFRSLDFQEVHVVLLEALGDVLSGFPGQLQKRAVKRLVKMGVDVRLLSPVAEITPEAVLLKDGTLMPTETVIWTAGVRGDPKANTAGLPTARNGQILVALGSLDRVLSIGYQFDSEDPQAHGRAGQPVICTPTLQTSGCGARDFEYNGNQADVDVSFPWPRVARIQLGYLVRLEDYQFPNSRTAFQVRRHDNTHQFVVSLGRDLMRNLRLNLSYIGVINGSNVAAYDYDRNIVGGNLVVTF